MDKVKVTVNLLSGQIEAAPSDESRWESDFLRALGYLLVQCNYLEDALADVYWIVTEKSWDEVREAIRGKPLGALWQLAVHAYEGRFPTGELRKHLEDLKPAIDTAIETRNAFVHASWVFDHAGEQMERSRLPRNAPGVQELRRLSVADVEAAIDVVGTAAERVWEELYDPTEIATRPTVGPRVVR